MLADNAAEAELAWEGPPPVERLEVEGPAGLTVSAILWGTGAPELVLLHGGSPKGAELIAAKWATTRKVPQIAFKPDWTRYAKAAPFKRNDAMLQILPIGVMHFPGSGIQDNLADKAKKLGIPVWKHGGA
jgi:hypothetical protein